MTTYLSLIGMLLLMMTPVLLPAAVTAFHAIANARQKAEDADILVGSLVAAAE